MVEDNVNDNPYHLSREAVEAVITFACAFAHGAPGRIPLGTRRVKLFVDECLSPQIATRLNATSRHGTAHSLHVGRCGQSDHSVLAWRIAEDCSATPRFTWTNHPARARP